MNILVSAGVVTALCAAMIAFVLVRQRIRDGRFAEQPVFTLQRWLLGTLYALRPVRIADLPYLIFHCARDMLRGGTRVPDPARTSPRPDTFGGVCRDLSPDTVFAAAKKGFYPWSHFGPLKWWTREQRMILATPEFRINKNVRRALRKDAHRVTFDTAFDDVIRNCAGRRKNRVYGLTWITPAIMRVYSELHSLGHAHSFEVWNTDGVLVGGGYGLSVGKVFVTESQFSHESNASKIGFAVFMYHLAKWGYVANDGKDKTPTLEEAGFKLIPRQSYEAILAEHATSGGHFVGPWSASATLTDVADWDPTGTEKPAAQAKPAKQPKAPRPPKIKSAA